MKRILDLLVDAAQALIAGAVVFGFGGFICKVGLYVTRIEHLRTRWDNDGTFMLKVALLFVLVAGVFWLFSRLISERLLRRHQAALEQEELDKAEQFRINTVASLNSGHRHYKR